MREIVKKNEEEKSKYERVLYSRSKIEKAGKIIAKNPLYSEKYNEYLPVVDNWRAAHAYPLDMIHNMIENTLSGMRNIRIVRRLKRIDSIIDKLQRPENSGLYRMQSNRS